MIGRWPHGDPRTVVAAVLRDPRYAQPSPLASPVRPSWLDLARDWLVGILRSLLHGLDRALGSNVPFESAIGFVLVAAAFALAAFGGWLLVRSALRAAQPRRVAATRRGIERRDDDAGTLLAAAVAAAQSGRYREASALLFASAARLLDERGRLPFDPARTPGEYRRLIGEPAFDRLAADAVVAVFAAADPAADSFDRMRMSYDRFVASLE